MIQKRALLEEGSLSKKQAKNYWRKKLRRKVRLQQMGAERGRAFEEMMERIYLPRMKDEAAILDFGRYPPNSLEDRAGKDFWISKTVGGDVIRYPFGVTTSLQSLTRAKLKHPHVPQFHFFAGASYEIIKEAIVQLPRVKP